MLFNTFTRKYFHFAHVILTMLSSTYHFWGVHNLYQAKLANSILESKVKLVCFSFFIFRFSFFIFRFSLFVFRFLLFDFVIRFSLLVFRFLLFVFHFSFFVFHFSFFDIQNRAEYCILTLELRQNIVSLHLKSYFDIRTGAEYHILTLKILFRNSKSAEYRILTFKILF